MKWTTRQAGTLPQPLRIHPTWEEACDHADRVARWEARHHSEGTTNDHQGLWHLLATANDTEDVLSVMLSLEAIGAYWWSMKEGDWIVT